jgi:hypothetical protein
VTAEDFRRQEEHLLDWIKNCTDDRERQAAHLTLNNLHQMRMKWNLDLVEEKPKRKPRKKLTPVEKFDKKNSRREAIMAQRARHG